MKKILLFAAALCTAQLVTGQAPTKPFTLYAIAEGNFGTPNGDAFKISRGNDTVITATPPLYQTANSANGFDVLQDFEIAGDKAIFITKSGNSKIAVANFPSFDSIHTFSITGGQCMGKASGAKVYVSYAGGNTIKMVDLVANTLTTVSDPAGSISSYATYMVQANGYMYAAMGTKIVKIDTLTNAVTGTITPGLGSIAGLQFDTVNHNMWILGKSGGTSAVVRMEVTNNDLLNTPIVFTGITNASQLRFCNNKLYFLSGKNVHIYDILAPNIPTTAVYTSTLGGSAGGFAYGKSFVVDPSSGDFAIGHANNYANPSLYEIVDGATFTQIATGSIANCKIVNELVLRTGQISTPPVPTLASLPDVKGQCSVTLTVPTAMSGTTLIQGTTPSPLTYTTQGTFMVTWTYSNGQDSVTQTQNVIIADTIPPVPDAPSLPALTVACPYTITTFPTATDNCLGTITATTSSPLTYASGGTYTVTWIYTDSNANVTSQVQTLNVDCNPNAVTNVQQLVASVYPNPARDELRFRVENAAVWTLSLKDMTGREIAGIISRKADGILPVAHLPGGIYFVTVRDLQTDRTSTQKVVVQH